jgi:hypothetical protein
MAPPTVQLKICFAVLLAALAQGGPLALPGADARLLDDASLGITRYDFRGVWEGVPGIMTVYLRPVCIGRTLYVRGVMGVTTVRLQADASDRYTAPAVLLDHAWALRLVDRSTNSSARVRVYKTVDRAERTLSYSQLEAALPAPKQLELFVAGSPWRHELYLPECALTSDAQDHPLTAGPGALLNDKHWLAVMLPRVLPVPMEQYASLVLSHLQYHRALGYAGTLLLTDLHQAHELMQQPAFSEAVAADSIMLWPWVSRSVLLGVSGGLQQWWFGDAVCMLPLLVHLRQLLLPLQEHEQPKGDAHPLYWQVPRYQLAAVAGWGRAMRAAFMDPDDFLVLPGGQPVTAEHSCLALQGSQAELLQQLHWEASLTQPGDGDEGAGGSSSSQAGGHGGSPAAAAAVPAVVRVPRFDAAIAQSGCSDAAACLAAHSRWWEQPGAQLAVGSCPVREGGLRASRRPVIAPHEVVAMRVFTAATKHEQLSGPPSPPSCAFILHITTLLALAAQPHGSTALATWQPPAAAAGATLGALRFDAGQQQQLPQRRPLLECQQQQLEQQQQAAVDGSQAKAQQPGHARQNPEGQGEPAAAR